MTVSLAESNACCQQLTRATGKNFYYSFLTLPKPLRQQMCVLYAFMRKTDDIGDDESVQLSIRKQNLLDWKSNLSAALENEVTAEPIFAALVELIRSRKIPQQYLFDVIEGVEMDLEPRRFATFDDLDDYCYRVAGAVGLCCIHIWGFTSEQAIPPAIACGTAFQLTNILRDLAEDSDRGRVYLPQEDLDRFGYSEDDIRGRVQNEVFRELMQFEVARAREFYAHAEGLFYYLEPHGKPIFRAMLRIYGGLLDRIEKKNFDVYTKRISLSKSRKWRIVLRSLLRV